MADLPELPDRIRRLHILRWKELIEKHGFTGGHLDWHDSPDKRRYAARPTYSLLPPPSDLRGGSVTLYGKQGEPVSYPTWHQNQMAAWESRESDPAVIDAIGVTETVALTKARFKGVVGDYIAIWANSTSGNSDDFNEWLQGLSRLTGKETADVWRKDEWHALWFDRACRPKVDDALRLLINEWRLRASNIEIKHLENPHLSLESLVIAEGDLALAFTLDQNKRVLENAQRTLNAFSTKGVGPRSVPTPAATEPAVGAAHSAPPQPANAAGARGLRAAGNNAPQGIMKERMRQPETWNELRADFLQYAVEHTAVRAVWRWIYEDTDEPTEPPDPKGQWALEGGSPGSQHLFRVVAERAAARLSNPSKAESWRLWLDRMRAEGYARDLPPRSVSMQEMRNLDESFRPLPPGFKTQHIEHVFRASADFCFARSLAEVNIASPSPATEKAEGGQRPGLRPSAAVDSAGADAVAERAAKRQLVVKPILKRKRWKPGRLATEAAVGKNSVYDYLDGTRAKITDENRAAIAEALGLKPEELPD